MADVSVIVSKRDTQSLEGFDVAHNFSDASGEYLYFKNTKGKLNVESIEIEGDLMVFNPKKRYEDASQSFLAHFDGFVMDLFRDDFDFAFNMMQKLNWDVLIRKDRLDGVFKSEKMTLKEAIDKYNMMFKKVIDANMMGMYKEYIYDIKVDGLLEIYESNPCEEAYDLLKEDFTQMVYSWRFTEFSVNTTTLNKLFFDDIVFTKTYDDFTELMEDYYIRVDMFYLNEDIRELRRQNKKIKQQTERLSKMNRDIINSRSWRMTKPLRSIK